MKLRLVQRILPEDTGHFASPEQALAYERAVLLREEIVRIAATVMAVDRYDGDGLSGGVDRNDKKRGDVLLIDAWVPEGGNQVFRGQMKCIPISAGDGQSYSGESQDGDDMPESYRLLQMGMAVTTDRGTPRENTSIYFFNEQEKDGELLEKYLKKDLDNHTWQEVTLNPATEEMHYIEYANYYVNQSAPPAYQEDHAPVDAGVGEN